MHVSCSQVVESSGAALANGGVTELKKTLESLKDGGVLFVDEVGCGMIAICMFACLRS